MRSRHFISNITKIHDDKHNKFAQWTASYQFKAMRNACPTGHDSQSLNHANLFSLTTDQQVTTFSIRSQKH